MIKIRIYKDLPFGGTVMGISPDEIKRGGKKTIKDEMERILNRGGLKFNE